TPVLTSAYCDPSLLRSAALWSRVMLSGNTRMRPSGSCTSCAITAPSPRLSFVLKGSLNTHRTLRWTHSFVNKPEHFTLRNPHCVCTQLHKGNPSPRQPKTYGCLFQPQQVGHLGHRQHICEFCDFHEHKVAHG